MACWPPMRAVQRQRGLYIYALPFVQYIINKEIYLYWDNNEIQSDFWRYFTLVIELWRISPK